MFFFRVQVACHVQVLSRSQSALNEMNKALKSTIEFSAALLFTCVCACVCGCVFESPRERERECAEEGGEGREEENIVKNGVFCSRVS